MRLAANGDPDLLLEGLRREGFVKDKIQVDPQAVLDYLAPFVEPARVDSFRFNREWMREQFERVNNPRSDVVRHHDPDQPAARVPPHPPHVARRHRPAQPARGRGAVPRDPRGVAAGVRRVATVRALRSRVTDRCRDSLTALAVRQS